MHFYSRLIFRRMSRLLCLVLCPALCLMPAACSPAAENSSGPAASSASSGTASETESDGGSGLVLFAGGAYTGTMVYARGDAAALSAAYTLKQTLEAVTGVTFSSRDRMREEGAETDTAGCEILIGNIERGQDSASLPLRGYRIEERETSCFAAWPPPRTSERPLRGCAMRCPDFIKTECCAFRTAGA